MKTDLILIRLGGVMNLLAAALHLAFWNVFDWQHELTKLSVMNSNIMQMLNWFTIVFFIYTGLLLLLKPKMISSTVMGRHFLGMLTVMWTARLVMEYYYPEGDLLFAGILTFAIFCFFYPLISGLKVNHKLDNSEHTKHPWHAYDLLQDFKIEDVWELPVVMNRNQSIGDIQTTFVRAIDELSRSGIPGLLFQFRFFLGKLFGWDDEVDAIDVLPTGSIRERYARLNGLNAADFSIPRGGQFIPVYQMSQEALSEIENATVHAAVHYGKVPLENDQYGVHMTVYVKPKGLFGRAYMQLIKPFRLFIVYPIMLNMIEKHWSKQQQLTQELAMV